MKKYFQEEEVKGKLLSSYLKEKQILCEQLQKGFDESEYQKQPSLYEINSAKRDIYGIKTIMHALGDIEISQDLFETYLLFFSIISQYGERSLPEGIKEIHQIKTMYPKLTAHAIYEISRYYTKDLFTEYDCKGLLKSFIDKYGETDEAFNKYYDCLTDLDAINQEKFTKLASKLDQYVDDYDKSFVDYMKYKVIYRHYTDVDKLISCFPTPELYKKDKAQQIASAQYYHIDLGVLSTMSETLIEALADKDSLGDYPEQLYYDVDINHEHYRIPTTFTKQEFLDSVAMQRETMKQKTR